LTLRCEDANLIDVPVRVSKEDGRLYRVAFFAQVAIPALEEFTWDYGCFFGTPKVDSVVPFHCKCGSTHCRDTVTNDHPIHVITDVLPSCAN